MNAKSQKPSWYSSNLRWYVVLAFLPVMIAIVVVLFYGYREWDAAQSVRSQRTEWAQSGVPYNNVSLKDWYTKRTHSEGTEEWQRILQLCNWGLGAAGTDRLPYLGSKGVVSNSLVPGGDWPEEPLVSSFLKEMEPVLDSIEKASVHPTPVRFPMMFDGVGTFLEHLQESRNVMRLLSLDFDYAYYHQDTKRALRNLDLMLATIKAFDSRETLVSELINIALRSVRTRAIRRSLTHSIWTDDELATLRKSMDLPEPLGQRWKDVITGERAFGLAAIEVLRSNPNEDLALGQAIQLFLTPSSEKTFLDYYERAINLTSSDMKNWLESAARMEQLIDAERMSLGGVWLRMLLPAVKQAISAEIRAEDDRRWTQTAIVLRQYKNQNGEWPGRLRDLEALGLGLDDYSTVNGQVFGFEVVGKSAYLWTADPAKWHLKQSISPTRPSKADNADSIQESIDDQLAEYVLELK
ncbi:MAG: hypothetical protein NTW52_00885 [Planctomycetota bacterium]|nr:hypothetical protein [Planctomycetota bacterium]